MISKLSAKIKTWISFLTKIITTYLEFCLFHMKGLIIILPINFEIIENLFRVSSLHVSHANAVHDIVERYDSLRSSDLN